LQHFDLIVRVGPEGIFVAHSAHVVVSGERRRILRLPSAICQAGTRRQWYFRIVLPPSVGRIPCDVHVGCVVSCVPPDRSQSDALIMVTLFRSFERPSGTLTGDERERIVTLKFDENTGITKYKVEKSVWDLRKKDADKWRVVKSEWDAAPAKHLISTFEQATTKHTIAFLDKQKRKAQEEADVEDSSTYGCCPKEFVDERAQKRRSAGVLTFVLPCGVAVLYLLLSVGKETTIVRVV